MTSKFDPYHEWLGIPPKDQPPNLYRLLGLEVFETNAAVIENAADRQMAHLRTLQSGKHSEDCQRLLTELSKAKVLLLRPEKKQVYDNALRKKLAHQRAAATPQLTPVSPQSTTPGTIAPVNPSVAQTSSLASSVASKRSRPQSKNIWTHPAVIAGAVGGGILAVVGLAMFLMGGGDDPVDKPPKEVVEKPLKPPVKEDPKSTKVASTFGVDDPVTLLARPEPVTLDEIRLAWGLVGDRFAVCQTGALAGLKDLSLRMAKTGYRLDQLRPYVFNGETKYAAIWRCDGRPFRVAIEQTPAQIQSMDADLKKLGFQPVDVAGYDDGTKYCAIWWIPSVGGKSTELTVGIDRQQSNGLVAKQKGRGLLPHRLQYCFNQDGVRYESLVWRKGSEQEGVVVRAGDQKQFEKNILTDLPAAIAHAFDPKRRETLFAAVFDKTSPSPRAWEALIGKTPRDTLPMMRGRMTENMIPYSLEVTPVRVAGGRARLASASVWNLKQGAIPNPRQMVVMATHKNAGAAAGGPTAGGPGTGNPSVAQATTPTDDTLLFQGNGGIEIMNSDAIAKLGESFTAEMWVKLSPTAASESRNCLMGTARGPAPLSSGWQLVAHESKQDGSHLELNFIGIPQKIKRQIQGDFSNWRHVAVGAAKQGSSWNVTLYVDGSVLSTDSIASNAPFKSAGNNLTVGVHPTGSCGEEFYGGIRQFRLTDGDRYNRSTYTTQKILGADKSSASSLDFKRSASIRMNDVTGNNRTGLRRAGTWLADGASWPSRPGGVAIETPSNGGASGNPPVAPMVVKRDPAPDKTAVDAAIKEIREVYTDEYKRATTPAARVALADHLRKQADEETDLPSRFALLQEAANAAAAGNNVTMAFAFVEDMEKRYEVELWEERGELISTAFKASRSRPQKVAVAQAAHDFAERAASQDQFDIAIKMFDSAASESRRAGDTELAKTANLRSRKVKEVRDQFRVAKAAEVKVAAGSAKPEDYLKLGHFRCFLRGEWEQGLPMLEKGSDKQLAALADAEKKDPTDAAEQSKLAEQWKTYADTAKTETVKNSAFQRAYYWCSQAAPQLTGLSRARVQRMMNELAELTGGVAVIGSTENLAFLDVKPGEIHRFNGHTRDIRALAVSPSGRYTASASYDGSIRVWDTATGRSLHNLTLTGGRASYGGVAISPDEKFVLAGASNNTVAAWDIRTGNPAFAIPTGSSVYDIDISPDGRKLIFAVSSSQANLGVYGLAKRRPLGVLKAQYYPRMVRISADGNKAISADSSGNVSLWNLVSFRPEANYSPQGGSINDIDYSRDGRAVAIATSSDVVHIWNPNSQKLEASLEDKGNGSSNVRSVRFTPDGKHIVVADYYRGIVVWNLASQKVVGRVGAPARFSSSTRWRIVELLPDPRGAVVGDTNGNMALFRLPDF